MLSSSKLLLGLIEYRKYSIPKLTKQRLKGSFFRSRTAISRLKKSSCILFYIFVIRFVSSRTIVVDCTTSFFTIILLVVVLTRRSIRLQLSFFPRYSSIPILKKFFLASVVLSILYSKIGILPQLRRGSSSYSILLFRLYLVPFYSPAL